MDTTEEQTLGGLVSAEAGALYARLLRTGGLPVGVADDEVDLDSTAARELLDARVARQSAYLGSRLIAVAEKAAVQLLLTKRQAEIVASHERIVRGWQRLDALLPLAAQPDCDSSVLGDPRVEILTDGKRISQLSTELYQTARTELLGISLRRGSKQLNQYNLVTPPQSAVDRGARFRMIYDADFAADPAGARIIENSLASGEEVRIRAGVPLKMLHVDDSVALVAVSPTGLDAALLVRSPELLAALRQWYELLWEDIETTRVDGTDADSLSNAQRQVLRLLSAGLSDEAIARATRTSVRTVRRHITAILELLGVSSRFAAGAAAAKSGWI